MPIENVIALKKRVNLFSLSRQAALAIQTDLIWWLFNEPVFRLRAGFAVQGLVPDEYVQLRPPITVLDMYPHLVLIASS
jgi:hypothetical protein